jgi:tRNA threonylcarbamoyladenosine biosynthesis protein TsaE
VSEEQTMSPNGPVPPRITLTISTADQMRQFGRGLATALRAGDLVILSGGLGAGKTTLTQGIADGLGVRGPITSPTFVIARMHPSLAAVAGQPGAGPALVHADAYRLGSALELDDLDLDTDMSSVVTVVEWGEGMAEGLSADRLEIIIIAQPGDSDPDGEAQDAPRTVLISAIGERWEGTKFPLAGLADRL